MNALCYKIVFSKRLGALVAVGEHTAGQGKAAGTGVRSSVFPLSVIALGIDGFVGSLKAVFASVALTFITAGASTAAGLAAPASNVLPTGYSVNAGKVAVTTSGAAMTIKQSTDKASLNWNSFSVGQDASVNVQQNNANSVLLNRVVGNEASQIFGKISANGQMVLINQNGIVFGKSGSVTSSAFTASTFNLSDDDFANGNYNYVRNGSKAGITNQGSIIATEQGGYIALIGANVSNEGSLKTVQGPVIMTAGDAVALPSAMTSNIQVPLSRKVRLELLPSTINAMVANTESGVITTDGGQVLMHAAAVSDAVANISANVVNSGKIDTTGVQGGAVTLRADDGYIKANGSITANSTGSDNNNQPLKGGDIIIGRDEQTGALAKATDVSGARLESNKGFVETSGQHLDSLGVNVKAAEWLLDPTNIEITLDGTVVTPGNSGVKASDIATALNGGTSVTISTGTTGSSSSASGVNQTTASATNNAAGTIAVNSAITSTYSGSSNPTLTLSAASNISINAAINTSGSNIFLKSTGGAISNTAAITGRNVSIDNTGGNINASTGAIMKGGSNSGSSTAINIAENITATGNLNLYGQATGGIGINLANGKTISGANIQATGQSSGNFGALFGYGNVVTTGSSGDSVITGISTGGGSDAFRNSANLTAAANTTLTIDGQATNTGARGMRMEGGGTASGNVTIKGSSNNSTDGLISINGIITAAANSSLKLIGTTNKAGNVGVQLSNGGGVNLSSNATVEITGQNTATTGSGIGILVQGWGIAKGTGATNTGLVKLTGTTASTSGSTSVAIQTGISTDGNIDIQGNVVNASNTGIQLGAAVKSFGAAPTINLDATNGSITGTGAIGDTTNKNASVSMSTATTGSFSGGINALNFTKAGAGTLTLDSWAQATPVMTNVSNSYNINAGRLNLNTGGSYYTVNTKFININNATTFGATGSNGTWSGNTFVFDSAGGGTLAWSGNPIMNVGTAALTFKTNGGVTNNITGWFNMNAGTADVTFDVAAASTPSNPGLLISGAGGGFTNSWSHTINKTGSGMVRMLNNLQTPTLNVNAGTWEFGDGSTGAGSYSVTAGNVANYNIASGATLSFNTPSAVTMDNPNTTFAGAGTIVKKGVGALQWGAGAATFNLSTGSLIDVQGGTFVASSGANEVWSSNKSSLNIASGAAFQTVEGQIQVDALNGAGSLVLGTTSSSYTSKMTVGVQGGSGSFSGAISNITSFNNGTFYKVGAGTQSLTGANTYTGATTVSGGTLQIGNGSNSGTLGSGSVSVASGSNLNFYRSDSISIGNSISGAGSLNFSGTNSTINFGQSSYSLSGDNSSFSGIINITSSRLGVSNQKNVGLSSSIAVSNGGTLYLNATANNVTLTNNLSLGGVGWTDGSGLGNLGALRLQNSSGYSANYAGNISLTSSTRVGAYGATGIISGAITGASGSNLEINASSGGTVIFTSNNNTYSGTTTINSGTLQIGNAGTSGRLGSGNVVNNSSLVFNRDASSDLTVANAISGSGNVTQTGAGRTILSSNNYYLGSTTITNGTLQIGNGETAGTLGTGGAVTLSNGANINFVRNTSTSIDNDISGNGNINAIITGAGSDLTINSNISISGASGSQTNNAILSSAGSINQTAGKTIAAKNLYLTAINGGIGLSGQRINTSVDNLSLNSSSSQYVTENDAVTVAAKTTSNGNIDITTTNGTMSIGSINGISGITADGSGDVNLRASSSSSHGIFSNQTIKGRNITMVANATSTSVRSLGYYGAGGSMEASEKLNLTGTSASEGNGFYIYSGTYKAGSGITITGTSLNGQGLGIEKDAVITNTSGNIILTGSANVINSNAIGLKGSKITNNGGNIELKAINGNVITGKVNPVWFGGVDPNTADLTATNTISSNGTGTVQITAGNASAINSGAIDGSFLSISQSTNGGDVLISTSGVGNVTSPRINNAGIGNVVLAAGSAVAAGTGSGGQVKTVSGNTITQSGTGKTLIFTGTLADTDRLSNLDDNLTYLFASDVGANKRNLTANKAYASGYSIAGGAQAQVIFRQAIDLGTVDFTATVNKTYGDVGYTQSSLTVGANQLMSDLSSALAASDLNSINLSGGNATSAIKFNKSTLVKQMALISTDWVNPTNFSSTGYRNSSSGNFIVNTAGSDFTVVASGTETLAIAQAKLTEVTGSKTYDGQNFSVTSGTSNGSLTITGVNGETASLKSGESLAITSANAGTTAVTSNGISSLNNSKLSSGGNIDLSNYDLSQAPVSTNSVAIAQAKLTEVSGSKIYDSNTNLSNGLLSIKGVNGEEFTTDKSTITLGSKNVVGTDGNGANSVINIANLILTGKNSTTTELASNYDLTQGSAINTVQITQAKLTEVTGSKTYDSNTNLSNGLLSIKGVNGEEFTTDKSTITLGNKNVVGTDGNGANSVINIANLILTGKNSTTTELASNYDLTQGSAINTVQITQAKLTEVTGAKIYDGTSKIKSNEILSIKGINGEEFIAESGTANISDKNVLTASKVLTDLSSLILIGKNDKTIELASNYRLGSDLPSAGSNNNVYITPKGITSDVFLPAVKSYDGSTKASTSVDTSNQVVSTDDVKIKFDETSPTYDSAVIGTGKKVTISGVALNGNDASNYSIASTIETKKNTINAAAPVTPVRTPAVTTSSSKSSKSGAAGANPFQLASAEVDIEEENVCSTASAASCKCESSSTAPGVSICYSGN